MKREPWRFAAELRGKAGRSNLGREERDSRDSHLAGRPFVRHGRDKGSVTQQAQAGLLSNRMLLSIGLN